LKFLEPRSGPEDGHKVGMDVSRIMRVHVETFGDAFFVWELKGVPSLMMTAQEASRARLRGTLLGDIRALLTLRPPPQKHTRQTFCQKVSPDCRTITTMLNRMATLVFDYFFSITPKRTLCRPLFPPRRPTTEDSGRPRLRSVKHR